MDEERLNLNVLEKKLGTVLKPINPEENFILNLRKRLIDDTAISIEKTNYFQILMVICIFFLFGLLGVWGIRFLVRPKRD